MKNLKTLDEFNRERGSRWIMIDYGLRLSGIACPMCGKEMLYYQPAKTLANYQVKKKVICPSCRYFEYRIVRTIRFFNILVGSLLVTLAFLLLSSVSLETNKDYFLCPTPFIN